MAVRKQKVVFKDVTPTDEPLPFPSITKSSGDFDTASQSQKPAVRPKLTLNLSAVVSDQPSLTQPCFTLQTPDSSRFQINQPTIFQQRKTGVFSLDKPKTTSQHRIKTNTSSPTFSISAQASSQTIPKKPSLGQHFDTVDTVQQKPDHGRQTRRSLSREPNDVDNTYLQSIKNYQVDVSIVFLFLLLSTSVKYSIKLKH